LPRCRGTTGAAWFDGHHGEQLAEAAWQAAIFAEKMWKKGEPVYLLEGGVAHTTSPKIAFVWHGRPGRRSAGALR
jgi:hypothetical protein